jgi:hypothetical protein
MIIIMMMMFAILLFRDKLSALYISPRKMILARWFPHRAFFTRHRIVLEGIPVGGRRRLPITAMRADRANRDEERAL